MEIRKIEMKSMNINKVDIPKPKFDDFNPKVDYGNLEFKKPFPAPVYPKDMKPVVIPKPEYKKVVFR